jgi:hypothetical protein
VPSVRREAQRLVEPEQIARIHQTTDRFGLNRDHVVVPLVALGDGAELVLPDGKLLIRPPGGAAFDPWFAGLDARLAQMDLAKVPRRTSRVASA